MRKLNAALAYVDLNDALAWPKPVVPIVPASLPHDKNDLTLRLRESMERELMLGTQLIEAEQEIQRLRAATSNQGEVMRRLDEIDRKIDTFMLKHTRLPT